MSNSKNPIIAPSVLGADFSNLQKEIKFCNESEAEWLHLDIMDQQFVPNLSFGPVISLLSSCAKPQITSTAFSGLSEKFL